MLAVVQGNLDYTTCNVPYAFWWVENISGASSGNDTIQEYDPAHVFENPIFSEKFGGFENYTCSGITKMNPNTPKTFFGYHYVGLLFDFIP